MVLAFQNSPEKDDQTIRIKLPVFSECPRIGSDGANILRRELDKVPGRNATTSDSRLSPVHVRRGVLLLTI
jgi:hypothetical protein